MRFNLLPDIFVHRLSEVLNHSKENLLLNKELYGPHQIGKYEGGSIDYTEEVPKFMTGCLLKAAA